MVGSFVIPAYGVPFTLAKLAATSSRVRAFTVWLGTSNAQRVMDILVESSIGGSLDPVR